jgi:hypothetical protein
MALGQPGCRFHVFASPRTSRSFVWFVWSFLYAHPRGVPSVVILQLVSFRFLSLGWWEQEPRLTGNLKRGGLAY